MTRSELERLRDIVRNYLKCGGSADDCMRLVVSLLVDHDAREEREAWSSMMPDDATTQPALSAVHGCCEEVD